MSRAELAQVAVRIGELARAARPDTYPIPARELYAKYDELMDHIREELAR